MALFTSATKGLWSWVSPAKNHEKRRDDKKMPAKPVARPRTTRHTAAPLSPRKFKGARSMSPESRINSWRIEAPRKDSSSPARQTKAASEYNSRDRSSSAFVTPKRDRFSQLEEDVDDEDLGQTVLTVAGDKFDYLARHRIDPAAQRARWDRIYNQKYNEEGWHTDEAWLFTKFSMLGFEPMLPQTWALDLQAGTNPNLPAIWFTASWDKAFIKNAFGSEWKAIYALSRLVPIAGRVSDLVSSPATTRSAERILKPAVESYMKWAYEDIGAFPDGAPDLAKLKDIPILAVQGGSYKIPYAEIESRMLAKLAALAAKIRAAMGISDPLAEQDGDDESVEPPTEADKDEATMSEGNLPILWGIILQDKIMGFVSFDPNRSRQMLRQVTIFNWGDVKNGFLNSFAVAILVVHCRNKMFELNEEIARRRGEDVDEHGRKRKGSMLEKEGAKNRKTRHSVV